MAEVVNLEFIAAQLCLVLDEQRALRTEQGALRGEQRRMADTLAGLSRSIEHIRDDLTVSIKAELGGLFANLETRLEHRIAAEIDQRLPQA
jgi:hypothetical protein